MYICTNYTIVWVSYGCGVALLREWLLSVGWGLTSDMHGIYISLAEEVEARAMISDAGNHSFPFAFFA